MRSDVNRRGKMRWLSRVLGLEGRRFGLDRQANRGSHADGAQRGEYPPAQSFN